MKLIFIEYDGYWGRKYYKSEGGALFCLDDWGKFYKCSPDGEPEYELDVSRYELGVL
jgi:hypothetical protein